MGFLDRREFGASEPDGRELLQALLTVYDREVPVRQFVLAAGMQSALFSWSLPMAEVWRDVRRIAASQGALGRLISAVAADPGCAAYPVFARLVSEPTDEDPQQPF